MKGCELCPGTARLFCESDQARLCFDCDAKVHGANFLVARHSRVLLCRACQSPTPWKAAGPRLGPTVSLCERCCASSAGARSKKNEVEEEDEGESGEREVVLEEEEEEDNEADEPNDDLDEDNHEEVEEDGESESSGDDDEEEVEEEGEEQVVPWSTEQPLPPPVSSSSGSEEEESAGRIGGRTLKRMRENVDLASSSCSQDPLPSSSSPRPNCNPNRTPLNPARTMADNETTTDSFRPLKDRKRLDFMQSRAHQLSAISFSSGRPPI